MIVSYKLKYTSCDLAILDIYLREMKAYVSIQKYIHECS